MSLRNKIPNPERDITVAVRKTGWHWSNKGRDETIGPKAALDGDNDFGGQDSLKVTMTSEAGAV